MTSEISHSMDQLLDELVGTVPGVVGALVASADGFTLAERLPAESTVDAAGLSAMSAASMALSNQLVAMCGEAPATVGHHVSNDGQVMMLPIAHVAVLTLLASPGAEAGVLARSGHEMSHRLQRLFRGTATV